MAIPKSSKLQQEEAAEQTNKQSGPSVGPGPNMPTEYNTEPIKIREVRCCNDNIAILVDEYKSNVVMSGEAKYKNEGIVVGVGPGISDGAGGRLKPDINIGDVVTFLDRNIMTIFESSEEPYAGKRVVVVSERSLITKLFRKPNWVKYS